MGNMSYCRFQNTAGDLKDCLYALQEAENGNELEKLSREEAKALLDMINTIGEIINFFDVEIVISEQELPSELDEFKKLYPHFCDF